eukprot:5591135-Pleurochrysis_carterae.AAC.1
MSNETVVFERLAALWPAIWPVFVPTSDYRSSPNHALAWTCSRASEISVLRLRLPVMVQVEDR